MVLKKSQIFTDCELDFMKVLWEKGETKPEDIREALRTYGRSVNKGTIRNMLVVMIQKGYISRRKEGKGYLYKATIHEIHAKKSILQNLLEHVFSGSEFQLVAALLSNHEVSTKEIDKIRNLLKEREKQ